MPDRAGVSHARLFLALWPDPETCRGLVDAGRLVEAAVGGRPSRPDTLHLTLVFIGALARARCVGLIDALAGLKAPAFELTLDRFGCWRHNRIAYLAPSEPPGALAALVAELEDCLAGLAIDYDRRAHCPHVTLARKADCQRAAALTSSALVIWRAGAFDLVESVPTPTGVRYQRLFRGLLTGRA